MNQLLDYHQARLSSSRTSQLFNVDLHATKWLRLPFRVRRAPLSRLALCEVSVNGSHSIGEALLVKIRTTTCVTDGRLFEILWNQRVCQSDFHGRLVDFTVVAFCGSATTPRLNWWTSSSRSIRRRSSGCPAFAPASSTKGPMKIGDAAASQVIKVATKSFWSAFWLLFFFTWW